jgi:leader peptidase (prepilin peptidase)/N-methyltransferase
MEFALEYLAVGTVLAGLVVLIILSVIDLKVWLLPNKWVLTFALLGVAFHGLLNFSLLLPHQMIYGALLGCGILYVIRICGNAYYKQDTLGLGDVKLLAAAGLWLGVEGVVIALTTGAFAGLLHGIGYAAIKAIREKSRINLNRLMIPAGPGFCIGIIAAWLYLYYGYWEF